MKLNAFGALSFSGFLIFTALVTALMERAQAQESRWLDQSHASFFPKSTGSIVDVQSRFPILWWDVLIVDSRPAHAPNWEALQANCLKFAEANRPLIAKIFCGANLDDLSRQEPLLREWAQDYPLRHARPSDAELTSRMNDGLAQASLPMGPIRGSLMGLLRRDPYHALPELQKLVARDVRFRLESHGGFFYDPQTQRVLIPLQFSFPATQTAKTAAVVHGLEVFCQPSNATECQPPILIGAHASTLENESRVKSDLHAVSWLSAVLLLMVIVFICWTRRWRLLLIAPPIFLAMVLATITTILCFGKIHGLTLAFGPGIVGLSMDYGLHIAFSNQPGRIWKANLYGLLTTVVVLLIMMLSQIPLLQQLMFFSAVGVALGSLFIYLIFKKYPHAFTVRSYGIPVPDSPAFSWVILGLVVVAIAGLGTEHLNLDMRQLGYQSNETAELSQWLYQSAGAQSPLLQVFSDAAPGASLKLAHEQRGWAETKGIRLSTVADFLPDLETQKANLGTWPEFRCEAGATPSSLTTSPWFLHQSPEARQFFKPFFETQLCGGLRPKDLSTVAAVPAYLRDFGDGHGWLTLWMPSSEAQVGEIKARYPGVLSFVDMAMMFPRVFAQELIWMVPISMALAFLLLVYYYRRLSLACMAVTPFFSGLGLCVLMNLICHWQTSFISVIGLIMVFGFSLDFGIFATDLMQLEEDRPDPGIWTALTVAAFINGCGFLPLMFCHHPVLTHLGRTLLFGTIGTYFGSIWGIPGLHRFLNRKNQPC